MKPVTRKEQFYDAIINGTETPTPLTREEYILKDIAENSGGGGSSLTFQLYTDGSISLGNTLISKKFTDDGMNTNLMNPFAFESKSQKIVGYSYSTDMSIVQESSGAPFLESIGISSPTGFIASWVDDTNINDYFEEASLNDMFKLYQAGDDEFGFIYKATLKSSVIQNILNQGIKSIRIIFYFKIPKQTTGS